MELVLLADVQNGYGSQWIRIANTAGVGEIQIGDCFREQGFGPGAEELKVAGIDISRVGGASKLFVDRAANATQPEIHRLGCVFDHVRIEPEPVTLDASNFTALPSYEIDHVQHGDITIRQQSRGRGRPPGSKNKPKPERVEMPVGFE
jgi:hypothetical protein